MMQIKLCPQRRNDALTVSKVGDILTINGEAFDFTSLPDGATIPAGVVPCEWITSPVERLAGQLHLTLVLPHGSHPSPAVAFPEAISDPQDGEIDLPFDEWRELVSAQHNGSGIVETYLIHRWQLPDETDVTFIPDINPDQEPADVDA